MVSKPWLAQEFKIPQPRIPTPNHEDITLAVLKKYEKIYIDFEKDLQKRASQAAKNRKEAADLDEAVADQDPTSLFSSAVTNAVAKALPTALQAFGLDVPEADIDMDEHSHSEKFVSSLLTKNYYSPPGGVGQSRGHGGPRAKGNSRGSGGSGSKRGKNGQRRVQWQ